MAEKNPGIVYVITNPSIPGKVIIGHVQSTSDDPFVAVEALNERIRQHSSASVPEPYELYYAVAVDDISAKGLLHRAFGFARSNNGEFFEIEPENVKAAMQLILIGGSEKITLELCDVLGMKKSAPVKKKQKRHRFSDFGIAKGEKLDFDKDGNIKVEVYDADSQEVAFCTQGFDKKPRALSRATCMAFAKIGHEVPEEKRFRGASHWKYKGRKLKEIFDGKGG